MTPHLEAVAFRIWRNAEPLGWDISVQEIAKNIGLHPRLVGRVVSAKGWNTRLRASLTDKDGIPFGPCGPGTGLILCREWG